MKRKRTKLTREFWAYDAEGKHMLAERIAYHEQKLAEERRGRTPDPAMRERIERRAQEILDADPKERDEEVRRKLAERIAYHEIVAEERRASSSPGE